MADSLTPQTLKRLVEIRIAEARVLLDAGFYDGACYLCGYVIELALKAVVCKVLRLADYPVSKLKGTFRTHSPEELLLLAGLQSAFNFHVLANPTFANNWATVTRFGPDQRYSANKTKTDAEEVIEAVVNEPDGVLQWLTQQW